MLNRTVVLNFLASDVVAQASGYILNQIATALQIGFIISIVILMIFARFSLFARIIIYILCGFPILYLFPILFDNRYFVFALKYILIFSSVIILTYFLPKIWPIKRNNKIGNIPESQDHF